MGTRSVCRAVLAVACLAMMSACNTAEPVAPVTVDGVYALVSVNDAPLPASLTVLGGTKVLDVRAGGFAIHADLSYVEMITTRLTIPGVPSAGIPTQHSPQYHVLAGQCTREGSALTCTQAHSNMVRTVQVDGASVRYTMNGDRYHYVR